jgi:hypothetical protein
MLYTDSNNIYSKCSSDTVPSNDKPVDATPRATPSDEALSNDKLVDTTPDDAVLSNDTTPVTLVDTDTTPVTSVDTTPVDTDTTPVTSVDTTPVDTTSVDTTSVDTTPVTSVDTTSVDTTPVTSVDTTSVDTKLINSVQSYPTLIDSVLTQPLKFFNFIENSELYVISVDDSPKFYVNNEKSAFDKMWEVTRMLSSKYVFDGYRTQFIKVNNNELHILGSYRFFIIAYDQILNRITYNKISQCM